jgi:gluconolactonase
MTKSNETIQPEIPVAGIYLIRRDDIKQALASGIPTKNTVIVAKDLSWPNGLAFSPDYGKLYVSNSDPKNPIWKVYDVNDDGTLGKGKIFFNATSLLSEGWEDIGGQVPDGLKVDIFGNIYAAGPGGVLVISPEGKLLGKLLLDRPVSNLVFGGDGRLYITAKDLVIRLWVKAKPSRIMKMTW